MIEDSQYLFIHVGIINWLPTDSGIFLLVYTSFSSVAKPFFGFCRFEVRLRVTLCVVSH